jgi:hypothetical protein
VRVIPRPSGLVDVSSGRLPLVDCGVLVDPHTQFLARVRAAALPIAQTRAPNAPGRGDHSGPLEQRPAGSADHPLIDAS